MTLRMVTLGQLALRDLWHGWQSSLCLVIATTAAMTPILILFGLYFGVVANLISSLTDDPRVREITLIDEATLTEDFFVRLRADPDVAFVQPRTSFLGAGVTLRSDRSIQETNLLPTGDGDPLLGGQPIPSTLSEIAISGQVAIALDVAVGDSIEMRFGRNQDGQRQRHPLTVVTIIPSRLLQANTGFVSVPLLASVEDWRQGQAVPTLGWDGEAPTGARTSYAGYRAYAKDVRSVPGLVARLRADGSDVKSNSIDVEKTLLLEDALGLVFLIVTVLVSLGYALTLSLHLAASVVEKARELSILRLLGMSSTEIAALPSLQGAAIAGVGACLAGLGAILAEPLINQRLDGLAGLEGRIFELGTNHLIFAVVITAAIGLLSGIVAGHSAARLEPSEGLRHD